MKPKIRKELCKLTKCVGGFPSSLITSLLRTALSSNESRDIRSLALAIPDPTPKLTILSNLDRAPSSSYELGLGRLFEFEEPSISL
jgi:hypothetical protein